MLGTATTSGTANGLQTAQAGPVVVQPNGVYTIHETITSGAGLGYGATYECLRGTTVVAGGNSPAGSLTMPSDQGAEVVCTFTNTPQATRLACDVNHYYSVSPAGGLVQGDAVTGATASVGTWGSVTSANALGVGSGGTSAYAMDRTTDGTGVTSILKWTPSGGFQTLTGTGYTTVAGGATIAGSVVAGAVEPSTGRYLFGKFVNSQFYVWSFTESNPTNLRYSFLGSFPTGATPNGNGDMGFDARGNLYVVGASTTNNVSSAAIFTVTAESLAAANGTTLAVNTSTTKTLGNLDATPAYGNVNGIAFSPRGTVYLSSSTSVYEFDATTWTRVAGTPRATVDSTDLAGCSSPATATVLKNVVGRAAAADQFSLTLNDDATVVATATTSGSATGRQAAQIGPVPVPIGTTLTFGETMAAGSTSALTAYTSVYECWADGVRLSTGAAVTGAVTMPNRLSVNVVCTYFNSPRPASTITVTKQVLDPATGTPQPAAGWTLGVTGSATAGTVSVLPGESSQQVTNASGTATWTALFGTLASRATLVVSEVQQTGFVFVSGACTVNGATVPTTFSTVGSVISASLTNIASAATVACTIVNRAAATLTLVKRVDFGSALPTDWTLTAGAPAGALPGPTGLSGTAATTSVTVTPGVPYRLSESGGTTLYVQNGPWQCLTSTGSPVTVSGGRRRHARAGFAGHVHGGQRHSAHHAAGVGRRSAAGIPGVHLDGHRHPRRVRRRHAAHGLPTGDRPRRESVGGSHRRPAGPVVHPDRGARRGREPARVRPAAAAPGGHRMGRRLVGDHHRPRRRADRGLPLRQHPRAADRSPPHRRTRSRRLPLRGRRGPRPRPHPRRAPRATHQKEHSVIPLPSLHGPPGRGGPPTLDRTPIPTTHTNTSSRTGASLMSTSFIRRASAVVGVLTLAFVGVFAAAVPATAVTLPGNIDPDQARSLTVHKYALGPETARHRRHRSGAAEHGQPGHAPRRRGVHRHSRRRCRPAPPRAAGAVANSLTPPQAASTRLTGTPSRRRRLPPTARRPSRPSMPLGLFYVQETVLPAAATNPTAPFLVTLPFPTGPTGSPCEPVDLRRARLPEERGHRADEDTRVPAPANSAEARNPDLIRWSIASSIPTLAAGDSITSVLARRHDPDRARRSSRRRPRVSRRPR